MTDTGLPHLPGVATVSEILTALEAGYTELKFFPAEAAGGGLPEVGQFPDPGGAVLPDRRHLHRERRPVSGLPNVGCVGGSWITPSDVVAAQDWARVAGLAAAAAAL
jgi:2-dehydro-3-deoxyphosphogluconate aldolase/(4S)-4-hydroxy-2-oxoglutarate aldolase